MEEKLENEKQSDELCNEATPRRFKKKFDFARYYVDILNNQQ